MTDSSARIVCEIKARHFIAVWLGILGSLWVWNVSASINLLFHSSPPPHYVSLLHLCIIHHLNHWYSLFFIKVFHDFYQLPFCAALMNSPCCVTFSAPFFSPFLLLSLSSLFFLCCFQPVKIFTLSRSTHAVRDLFFYNFFFYIALSRLSYQHCLQRQESK